MIRLGPYKFHDSFKFAWDGLYYSISTQRNFQIMLGFGIVAILLGYIFNFDVTKQSIILVTTLLVLMVELINTSIENMNNSIHDSPKDEVRISKDSAAAASLLVSILAGVVGLYLFLPPFLTLFFGI